VISQQVEVLNNKKERDRLNLLTKMPKKASNLLTLETLTRKILIAIMPIVKLMEQVLMFLKQILIMDMEVEKKTNTQKLTNLNPVRRKFLLLLAGTFQAQNLLSKRNLKVPIPFLKLIKKIPNL